MANVLDYLKWRKDLTFKQDSFNEVDALILARLSYIPFDGILSQNSMETISLSKAISIFLKDPDCKEKVVVKGYRFDSGTGKQCSFFRFEIVFLCESD